MPDSYDFPPDIFWIKPTGEVISVIGHLTAMQQEPETFGLPAAPEQAQDIDKAFTKLWGEGWTRGRYDDGALRVQMGQPAKTPLEYVRAMAERHRAFIDEVEIDFANPVYWKMGRGMKVDDFLGEKYPAVWGLGDAARRGKR